MARASASQSVGTLEWDRDGTLRAVSKKSPASGDWRGLELVLFGPGDAPFPTDNIAADMQLAVELRRASDQMDIAAGELGDLLRSAFSELAVIPAGAADPGSGLTMAERGPLERAGAILTSLPGVGQRASAQTAARNLSLILDALNVKQVAQMLGRSEVRIRQRLADRTLFGVRLGSGWRIPSFQFADGRELPGWGVVVPAFPRDVLPVAVESFLERTNTDLDIDGDAVSPRTWLSNGLDPERVAQAVSDAYVAP